jgi:4-hydroxythreonine-4-phosphate dehydrogenase
MEDKKIRVAITQGDTNGIGYELIFKTFAAPEMLELCTPVIYGSPKIAAYHRKALNTEANFSIISKAEDVKDGRINLLTCFDDEVKVELGVSTPESAEAGVKALKRALSDAKEEAFDALVVAPLDKNAQAKFPGQAEFIATALGTKGKSFCMMVSEQLRIALATDDLSIKDVANAITSDNIMNKISTLHQTLKRDFRISNPRIAVLALNPNADGTEEQEIIAPAINQMADSGVQAFGPFAADEFFGTEKYNAFDAVLAMYHDQGVTPLKTLSTAGSYGFFAGLPIVCTESGDTPSFSIAGKNITDENTFRQAIYTAIDTCRNRINYDEPFAHPLPKLYHEKRDESEKVRFAIPKKRAPENAEQKENE